MPLQILAQRDQGRTQAKRRALMVAVNPFDLLRQRYQPFQFGAVGVMIAAQYMVNQRRGGVGRIVACRSDQRLQICHECFGQQTGLQRRFAQRDIAAAAKTDAFAAEQFRRSGQVCGNRAYSHFGGKSGHV